MFSNEIVWGNVFKVFVVIIDGVFIDDVIGFVVFVNEIGVNIYVIGIG